jgi:large subunit ribosomal protein L9
VTANEIADALEAKGVNVDKRRIELAHPIKNIGVHDVEVRLHRDVAAHIQVEVQAIGVEKLEEAPAAEAAASAENQ